MIKDVDQCSTTLRNGCFRFSAERELCLDGLWRWHRIKSRNVQVANGLLVALGHDKNSGRALFGLLGLFAFIAGFGQCGGWLFQGAAKLAESLNAQRQRWHMA